MQEQSSAEYIRKLKAKIASLPRKERIKRLEHERHNSPNRTVAKHLDELIREERGGYRRRVTLKLAGWAVILAAIFYVLIAFGQPHPQKQVADAGSRSSKVQKSSTSHKKHKAKHQVKKHKAASSSSAVAASSSSSSSVSAAASSSSTASATSRASSSSQVQSSSTSTVQRASVSSSTRRATQTQTQTQQAQTTQTQQTTRSSQTSTYTIQNGDNMYRIAVNHGMTLSELQALNGMGSSTSLTPGQTIRVR
jgi:LysM repeat protein